MHLPSEGIPVSTSPGEIAMNRIPSEAYWTWYFATARFSAILDME